MKKIWASKKLRVDFFPIMNNKWMWEKQKVHIQLCFSFFLFSPYSVGFSSNSRSPTANWNGKKQTIYNKLLSALGQNHTCFVPHTLNKLSACVFFARARHNFEKRHMTRMDRKSSLVGPRKESVLGKVHRKIFFGSKFRGKKLFSANSFLFDSLTHTNDPHHHHRRRLDQPLFSAIFWASAGRVLGSGRPSDVISPHFAWIIKTSMLSSSGKKCSRAEGIIGRQPRIFRP